MAEKPASKKQDGANIPQQQGGTSASSGQQQGQQSSSSTQQAVQLIFKDWASI